MSTRLTPSCLFLGTDKKLLPIMDRSYHLPKQESIKANSIACLIISNLTLLGSTSLNLSL